MLPAKNKYADSKSSAYLRGTWLKTKKYQTVILAYIRDASTRIIAPCCRSAFILNSYISSKLLSFLQHTLHQSLCFVQFRYILLDWRSVLGLSGLQLNKTIYFECAATIYISIETNCFVFLRRILRSHIPYTHSLLQISLQNL